MGANTNTELGTDLALRGQWEIIKFEIRMWIKIYYIFKSVLKLLSIASSPAQPGSLVRGP